MATVFGTLILNFNNKNYLVDNNDTMIITYHKDFSYLKKKNHLENNMNNIFFCTLVIHWLQSWPIVSFLYRIQQIRLDQLFYLLSFYFLFLIFTGLLDFNLILFFFLSSPFYLSQKIVSKSLEFYFHRFSKMIINICFQCRIFYHARLQLLADCTVKKTSVLYISFNGEHAFS